MKVEKYEHACGNRVMRESPNVSIPQSIKFNQCGRPIKCD